MAIWDAVLSRVGTAAHLPDWSLWSPAALGGRRGRVFAASRLWHKLDDLGATQPKERRCSRRSDTVKRVSGRVDTSKAPFGERAARKLVESLTDADDTVERHYLEVKSDVDLKSASGRAKVAKFILGAANRVPAVARKYFEGYAVMVLGVGQGAVSGIEPIEMLQLQQWLSPYLSPAGPGWDISRVPLPHGREVLLVIVDPPEHGQAMYVCNKDFQDARSRKGALRDGAIYVRGDGETREATSADWAALVERASGPPRASLSVSPQGEALAYEADTSGLRQWVSKTKRELLDALPGSITELGVHKAGGLSLRGASATYESMTQPEDRTEDEYRAEIVGWEAACLKAMPTALDVIAASAWSPLTFRIQSDTWLEDAEIQIHLDGDVEGVEVDPDGRRMGILDILPTSPRRWGPRPRLDLSRLVSAPTTFVPYAGPSRSSFTNGGSVTLKEDIGDLRPQGEAVVAEELDMVLLVKNPRLAEVTGSWRLTARGQNRVYEGEITVAIQRCTIAELVSALHPER